MVEVEVCTASDNHAGRILPNSSDSFTSSISLTKFMADISLRLLYRSAKCFGVIQPIEIIVPFYRTVVMWTAGDEPSPLLLVFIASGATIRQVS